MFFMDSPFLSLLLLVCSPVVNHLLIARGIFLPASLLQPAHSCLETVSFLHHVYICIRSVYGAQHDLAVCTCSPEGQLYPGLHQEKRGQQGEGGDSAPLLCSGETPCGVLRPPLKPSAQERHRPVGAGPEKGHKNDQRDGTPLLGGKAERGGAIQPGEEKPPGRPYSSLPVPERAYKKAGEGLFTRAGSDRTSL